MKVFVFIPGILSKPSDYAWTDRAVDFIAHRNKIGLSSDIAFRQEYFETAIFRRMDINNVVERVLKLTEDIIASGLEPVLVGHSNGSEIICRVVRLLKHGQIRSIHLIAGACSSDFRKSGNGLNLAIDAKKVSKVFCYCSKNDDVLGEIAALSRGIPKKWWHYPIAPITWIGHNIFGLGYDDLGYKGPSHLSNLAHGHVFTFWNNEEKHSTWINEELSVTLTRIINHA